VRYVSPPLCNVGQSFHVTQVLHSFSIVSTPGNDGISNKSAHMYMGKLCDIWAWSVISSFIKFSDPALLLE